MGQIMQSLINKQGNLVARKHSPKIGTSPSINEQTRVDTSIKVEKTAKAPNKMNTTRNAMATYLNLGNLSKIKSIK